MPIFTITTELRNATGKHDYTALAQELNKQKCFQIQGTTWLGSFANDATQVHNFFRRFMDKADGLLVAELHQHFCYTGAAKGITKWLELNPPAALPNVAQDKAPTAATTKSADKAATSEAPAAKPAAKAPAKSAKAAAKKAS